MHKLKDLAIMYLGIAGSWGLWFWWPEPGRKGLTPHEKFGLWYVGIGAVFGTIWILAGFAD